MAGLVFAEVVADAALARDVRALAPRHGVTEAEMEGAVRFAVEAGTSWPGDDPSLGPVLVLARTASASPAQIDAEIVAGVRESKLSAAVIVELVCWLSVLQMLHRLTCFYSLEEPT